jgi:hypothetical protein
MMMVKYYFCLKLQLLYITLQHPAADHLLGNVTDLTVLRATCLNMELFKGIDFKSISTSHHTTFFGQCSHHQVFKVFITFSNLAFIRTKYSEITLYVMGKHVCQYVSAH